MDKISYSVAVSAENKASQSISSIKDINSKLVIAEQTIQQLNSEIEILKTQYNTLKTQLDNVTPFNINILNDYAKKIQDINTDTVFIDSNTGNHFKMYILNNLIALEEIEKN